MRRVIVQQWVTVDNVADEHRDLVLVEAAAFENGVALLRYEFDNNTASER